LSGGSSSIIIPAHSLQVGTDTLKVSYSGDSNYLATTSSTTITVTKATAKLTITPASSSVGVGSALTVAVKVTGSGPTATGNITLSAGSYTSAAITLSSGSASILIPANSLQVGTDTLKVSYSGDSNYLATTSSTTITVTKATAKLAITPASSSVALGSALTVAVKVTGPGPIPTGSITVLTGESSSTPAALSSGSTTITVPASALTVGIDTLSVSYTGDGNYLAASASTAVTVTRATPALTITPATNVAIGSSLAVAVKVNGSGSTPTGSVILSLGTYTSAGAALSSGSATVVIPASNLSVGTDTLNVDYSGDRNYLPARSSATVRVTKSAAVLTITPGSSRGTTCSSFKIAVKMSGPGPTPTGSITLSSGSYFSGPVALSSGRASITIPAGTLAVGTDTLNVSYPGDGNYLATSSSATVTVGKSTPSLKINSYSSSVARGSSLSVKVTVSGSGPTPTGSITLSSGNYSSAATDLSSGSTSILIPANSLAIGTDALNVSYSGDGNYLAASSSITVTITKSTPAMTITPASGTITLGSSLDVLVKVGASGSVPTGNISLSASGYTSGPIALTSGTATITLPASALAVGTNTLNVSYTGDGTYLAAKCSATVIVSKATPTLKVTPAKSSVAASSALTIAVVVSGLGPVPTGSITISSGDYRDGPTVLSRGGAAFVIPASSLPVGTDTLNISYTGDGNYLGASSSATVIVTKSTPSLKITPATTSVATGSSLAVVVAVSGSGPVPTGSIILSAGTYTSEPTALSSGSTSLTIPANSLAVGTDALKVSYSGDGNYLAGTTSTTVTITKSTPAMTITPASSSVAVDAPMSVAIAVGGTAPVPTGSITLSAGNYASGHRALSNGAATITIPANSLSVGTDTLNVSYTGDANYLAAIDSATVTVSKSTPSLTVTPASSSVAAGAPLGVAILVSGSGPMPTGNISVSAGSYTSAPTALSRGRSSIVIPANTLLVGTNTLKVTYAGDSNYVAATRCDTITVTKSMPALTVDPASSSVAMGTPLSVKVTVSGSGSVPTGSVTLSAGSYNSAPTVLSGGGALLIIPANALRLSGEVLLTATYSGDSAYMEETSSTRVTIRPPYSLTATRPEPVLPGESTRSIITVKTDGSYSGSVALSCAFMISPGHTEHLPTCSIRGSALTFDASHTVATATLIIDTSISASAKFNSREVPGFKLTGTALLTSLLFLGLPMRRRLSRYLAVLATLVVTLGVVSGCSETGGNRWRVLSQVGPGNYALTVTGIGTPSVSPAPTATIIVRVD
jgi:hypothetical protein